MQLALYNDVVVFDQVRARLRRGRGGGRGGGSGPGCHGMHRQLGAEARRIVLGAYHERHMQRVAHTPSHIVRVG